MGLSVGLYDTRVKIFFASCSHTHTHTEVRAHSLTHTHTQHAKHVRTGASDAPKRWTEAPEPAGSDGGDVRTRNGDDDDDADDDVGCRRLGQWRARFLGRIRKGASRGVQHTHTRTLRVRRARARPGRYITAGVGSPPPLPRDTCACAARSAQVRGERDGDREDATIVNTGEARVLLRVADVVG